MRGEDEEAPAATFKTTPPLVPDEDAVLLGEEGEKKGAPRMITVPYIGELDVAKVKKYSCLSLTWFLLLAISISMILAGALPNKDPNDVVVELTPTTRTYYIQAEEVNWTFTPGGKDALLGPLYQTYVFHQADPLMIGGSIIKGAYRGYTDATFTTPLPGREPGGKWEHLGMLGPVLYAAAGDTVQITLRNMLGVAINLEPMGAHWNIAGLLGPVASGNTASFAIEVPAEAAPSSDSRETSRMYMYRSSQSPTRHENSGLVGPMIISRPGTVNADGSPKGVDREFITLFQIYFEVETVFIAFNAKEFKDGDWSLHRYTINGYSFGTLPGLNGNVGEKIRWYIGSLGTENAMHNFHWHGNVLEQDGHYLDQATAIPATTQTLDMSADNPGTWLYHCHVNSHLTNGMSALYTIKGALPIPPVVGGKDVRYFIAADEVDWNYLPMGGIACGADGVAVPVEEGSEAAMYVGMPEYPRIGSVYKKAIFREYTDANFTTLKERSEADAYLGLLGPVLRAQVGDTIRILFKNNMVDHPGSMHPHGVLYNKSSEGSPYMDGTWNYDKADDAVRPGAMHEYIWAVPERAGPGFADPSSVMWMYHSHSDEALDTWAGLAGPMIITRRGAELKADGSPADVDSEVTLFLTAMDEAQSLFTADNIATYFGPSYALEDVLLDEDFHVASLHRSINGFMFCNMPKLTFTAGSRVRFHYMSLGDIFDMHTPAVGLGGGFINLGQREDAIQMSAGGMHSVDAVLTEPGSWHLGCNVLEHEAGGLVGTYEVLPKPGGLFESVSGVVRSFYLAAENTLWDYAPASYVQCTAMNYSLRADLGGYLRHSNESIGSGMYRKVEFREYTDPTFVTYVPRYDYMGMLGPLMVMEPGDVLRVTLLNSADFPINFSPGGGLISRHDEVAGMEVLPGETFTYEWLVPEEAGPTPSDLSSVAYGYSSNIVGSRWEHALLGLEGMLVVVRKGELVTKPSGELMPRDVDQLVPLLWQVFDENSSPYIEENMLAAGLVPDDIEWNPPSEAFFETNMKHGINGYMYCNLPAPRIFLDSRARLLFLSVGGTEGLHAPVVTHFPLLNAKGPHPSAMLMPGYTSTLDLYATEAGTWPMWCNVHDHMEAGMIGEIIISGVWYDGINAKHVPPAPLDKSKWPVVGAR
ncbi:hypothetical protein FOA52_009762 [Chlamydomonas sp. UWO 241]|nr:hypothetical protein FOA52_009762 [Chlamydomonas sp. UWO 241]